MTKNGVNSTQVQTVIRLFLKQSTSAFAFSKQTANIFKYKISASIFSISRFHENLSMRLAVIALRKDRQANIQTNRRRLEVQREPCPLVLVIQFVLIVFVRINEKDC